MSSTNYRLFLIAQIVIIALCIYIFFDLIYLYYSIEKHSLYFSSGVYSTFWEFHHEYQNRYIIGNQFTIISLAIIPMLYFMTSSLSKTSSSSPGNTTKKSLTLNIPFIMTYGGIIIVKALISIDFNTSDIHTDDYIANIIMYTIFFLLLFSLKYLTRCNLGSDQSLTDYMSTYVVKLFFALIIDTLYYAFIYIFQGFFIAFGPAI